MLTSKRKLGDLGEELARKYLERKGYLIIAQNYHSRGGEIDIVALDPVKPVPIARNSGQSGLPRGSDGIGALRGQFVFVEVKTRLSGAFGFPAEAVTAAKQRKMILTAKNYLLEQNKDPDNFRLDAIGVELDQENRRAKIKHFESITNN